MSENTPEAQCDGLAGQCTSAIQSIIDEYKSLRKEECDKREQIDHFGEGCYYLEPAIKGFEEKIMEKLESLIKLALPDITCRRAMLSVYSLCEGAFEEWVELRFPFMIGKSEWESVIGNLGLTLECSAGESNLECFREIVKEHVKHYKDIYSKSVTRIPLNPDRLCYANWSDVWKSRANEPPPLDSDYWKLGIPLFEKDLFVINGKELKIRKIIEDSMGIDESMIDSGFKAIYNHHSCNKGKWQDKDRGEKLDAILNYLRANTKSLSEKEKLDILTAHIIILPRPPVIGLYIDFIARPLALLWVELDKASIAKVNWDKFGDSPEGKRLECLGEHFIKKMVLYWKEARERLENQEDVNKIIGKDFILKVAEEINLDTACETKPGSDTSSRGIKLVSDPLRPFFFNYKYGFMNTEQLSLKLMVDFWANLYPDVLKEDSLLMKFQEAQRLLFWLEEYRDHLVHSLKVYLLGRAIMEKKMDWWIESTMFQEIFTRNKIKVEEEMNEELKKKMEEEMKEMVRFAWASAAFFHDFTIGLEKIEEVVNTFIEKFTTKRPKKTPKLEDIQNGLSEWIVKENLFYAFFAILHEIMLYATGDEKIDLRLPIVFHSLESKSPSVSRDVFFRFLGKGDHGVSSAITYLTQVYPNLQEPTITKNGDESTKKGKDQTEKEWCKDSLLHFKIAEAILMHSIVFQTIVKPNELNNDDADKTKAVYFLPKQYDLDFDKNPMGFLLALCDTLQDWGRMETKLPNILEINENGNRKKYEISKRPFGHIKEINHHNMSPSEVTLEVDYKWLGRSKGSKNIVELKELLKDPTDDFAFCPWECGKAYKKHENAPKGCKNQIKEDSRGDKKLDCFEHKNRESCREFAKSFVHLKEIMGPRLHLGGARRIKIVAKYHGESVTGRDTIEIV